MSQVNEENKIKTKHSCLTAAKGCQRCCRADHSTGGHENKVWVYKKMNYELHMAVL
jgi:hypothetical protein